MAFTAGHSTGGYGTTGDGLERVQDRGGECLRRLHRDKVTDACQQRDGGVAEVVGDAVAPRLRKQRVVLGPEDRGRGRDSLLRRWRLLVEATGNGAGPGPIPRDRCGERAWLRIVLGKAIENFVRLLIVGSRPMRPEMLQGRAHLCDVAVDELGCGGGGVKVLGPELALKGGVQ